MVAFDYQDFLEYCYMYDMEFKFNQKKQKINFIKYQPKTEEEILKEHRKINKVLRKSLKKSKMNKRFNNNY